MDLRVIKDQDVDEIKKEIKDMKDTFNIHLDIRNSELNKQKFGDLFKLISQGKPNQFRLDLTEIDLDDEKIQEISKCFEKWDLNKFKLIMSNLKMNEEQFENIFNAISKMKNLQHLHLEMENVNMNNKKRKIIDKTLKEMTKLNDVYISVRKNKIPENEINQFYKLVERYTTRYFLV